MAPRRLAHHLPCCHPRCLPLMQRCDWGDRRGPRCGDRLQRGACAAAQAGHALIARSRPDAGALALPSLLDLLLLLPSSLPVACFRTAPHLVALLLHASHWPSCGAGRQTPAAAHAAIAGQITRSCSSPGYGAMLGLAVPPWLALAPRVPAGLTCSAAPLRVNSATLHLCRTLLQPSEAPEELAQAGSWAISRSHFTSTPSRPAASLASSPASRATSVRGQQ